MAAITADQRAFVRDNIDQLVDEASAAIGMGDRPVVVHESAAVDDTLFVRLGFTGGATAPFQVSIVADPTIDWLERLAATMVREYLLRYIGGQEPHILS